jgi:hypothetical protein
VETPAIEADLNIVPAVALPQATSAHPMLPRASSADPAGCGDDDGEEVDHHRSERQVMSSGDHEHIKDSTLAYVHPLCLGHAGDDVLIHAGLSTVLNAQIRR